MRSWILFHLYGGDALVSLFLALLIVVLLDLVGFEAESKLTRTSLRVVLLASLPLGALTGTPVSIWLAVPLILAWLWCASAGMAATRKTRAMSASVLLLLAAVVVITETAYLHQRTTPPPPTIGSVAVLGDSLTSGGFGESHRWTDRLATHGLTIFDLSAPSATAESAVRYQAPDIPLEIDAVILELGGNDMLDGAPLASFESNLRLIIRSIRETADRDVPIFFLEFPVLPGHWTWASAQRRVARDEQITIIPKRVLARILLRKGNTFDGLHLTDQGHEELAKEIEAWLR